MANKELKNAQADTLLSDIAQGTTTGTLTSGNFGTPATAIYLTFDYDVAAKYEVKLCTVAGVAMTAMSHVSGANVAHTAGCKVGRMINAEVIKDITDITDNHETRLATAEADITVVESGWTASPALTFAAADSPTFTATATGDYTTKLYPGVRVKNTQVQAIQNYWSFDTNSADSKGGATMADIGTPTYTAGKFSNALTLNGTNQALSITDAAALKPTDNFTIGCWFKTSNTGAFKTIFQSQSTNSNQAGIQMLIDTSNNLYFNIGNNTGAGPVNYSKLTGATTVTDGNWHYAAFSFRNNFGQLYLDGKLEASGYMMTPAYAATNYVRIGCQNNTGSNTNWFNGQIDDLFIAAYALDEQTIAAKYAAATAQGTGDLTLTKYALCTASSYSAPNTTITLYGGTDHALANATISNAYYSTQKAPYGFPLGADRWRVEYSSRAAQTQTTPTQNVWYNIGGSISVPIGLWNVGYSVVAGCGDAGVPMSIKTTLSTANNSESDPDMSVAAYDNNAGVMYSQHSRYKDYSISAKSTRYLNILTDQAGVDITNMDGSRGPIIIRATSTLL